MWRALGEQGVDGTAHLRIVPVQSAVTQITQPSRLVHEDVGGKTEHPPGPHGDALGVQQDQGLHGRVLEKGLELVSRLGHVHRQHHQATVSVRAYESVQGRQLRHAGRTPARPEVEQNHPSPVRPQVVDAPAAVGQAQRRRLRRVRIGPEPGTCSLATTTGGCGGLAGWQGCRLEVGEQAYGTPHECREGRASRPVAGTDGLGRLVDEPIGHALQPLHVHCGTTPTQCRDQLRQAPGLSGESRLDQIHGQIGQRGLRDEPDLLSGLREPGIEEWVEQDEAPQVPTARMSRLPGPYGIQDQPRAALRGEHIDPPGGRVHRLVEDHAHRLRRDGIQCPVARRDEIGLEQVHQPDLQSPVGDALSQPPVVTVESEFRGNPDHQGLRASPGRLDAACHAQLRPVRSHELQRCLRRGGDRCGLGHAAGRGQPEGAQDHPPQAMLR